MEIEVKRAQYRAGYRVNMMHDLINLYQTAFFTASITVGVFIFTMKSFVVQMIKREVFDNKDYIEFLEQCSSFSRDEMSGARLYGPLRRLSRALFICVSFSFVNAFFQVIIPIFGGHYWIVFLFFFNAATWVSLGFSVFLVTKNVSTMINFYEWVYDKRKGRKGL